MKVQVRYEGGIALAVRALEGPDKGKVIANVDAVLLKEPERDGDQASGLVAAIWGAEIPEDTSNESRLGLAIGKPWPEGYDTDISILIHTPAMPMNFPRHQGRDELIVAFGETALDRIHDAGLAGG
jgi:hypothetical protein